MRADRLFRIEKTRDYTVMSNHHLRDMSLSLKAKGLLSLMLSLPENWDYTMKGLARICKDGIDSISGGIRELEEHGYLIRERVRGANGQLGSIEYTILEQPKEPTPAQEKPIRENPVQANPTLVTPVQEEPAQLNKEESSNGIFRKRNRNGAIWSLSLSAAVFYLTPVASDGFRSTLKPSAFDPAKKDGNLSAQIISQEQPVSETAALNPDWVEWLMGFPKGWTDVNSGPPSRKESPA